MVRSCEILFYDGLTLRDADCNLTVKRTLHQIPDFFNCYMYETKGFLTEFLDRKVEYPIVGMSLILYLDSFR